MRQGPAARLGQITPLARRPRNPRCMPVRYYKGPQQPLAVPENYLCGTHPSTMGSNSAAFDTVRHAHESCAGVIAEVIGARCRQRIVFAFLLVNVLRGVLGTASG